MKSKNSLCEFKGEDMSTRVVGFDWAIKYLLRDKENFPILDGFLSSLLKKDIEVLEIIESESTSENQDVKINKVDLMVKSENEQFIIEIQNSRESDYFERILFGTSKVVVEKIKAGGKYKDIKKIISVNIIYYDIGRGEDYIYHGKTDFIGMNKNDKLIIRKKVYVSEEEYKLEEINIFPEYYLIRVEKFDTSTTLSNPFLEKSIDEWIYLFKTGQVEDNFKSKGMELVRKKLSYINMTPEQQRSYDNYLVTLEREEDLLNTAKLEGVEEGIGIGVEKGELNKGIKIAEKMILRGDNLEDIVDITELPLNKILEIKKSLN